MNMIMSMGEKFEVKDKQASNDAADPNEVDWEGPEDVHNPRNWPVWQRGMIVGILTSIVFLT
jgi:hypothetical protein